MKNNSIFNSDRYVAIVISGDNIYIQIDNNTVIVGFDDSISLSHYDLCNKSINTYFYTANNSSKDNNIKQYEVELLFISSDEPLLFINKNCDYIKLIVSKKLIYETIKKAIYNLNLDDIVVELITKNLKRRINERDAY